MDNQLKRNTLFNPSGDIELRLRRMIGGNTTNLNDFNNMKYSWVSDWYRQAMNNFWIPEEINLSQDFKDYPRLEKVCILISIDIANLLKSVTTFFISGRLMSTS